LIDLRPKEKERLLREMASWEDSEEEQDDDESTGSESPGPAMETNKTYTYKTSQQLPGDSSGGFTGDTAGSITRSPSGFLDPEVLRSKHNKTKWLVLNALMRLAREGAGTVYDARGAEYSEWQLQGGLVSSLVATTGLSRSAVSGCLRRCQQAHYVRVVGKYSLLRGSRASLFQVTGKGQTWLGWAKGTGLSDGKPHNG
jgi:hypothetical protein